MANTKERDFSIGLDNHGFRYFDPEAGRYVSRDPIGYGDGMNVYVYVGNNPINFVDPVGLNETAFRVKRAAGHHLVPFSQFAKKGATYGKAGKELSKEFVKQLNKIVVSPGGDLKGHVWDAAHTEYNKRVGPVFEAWIEAMEKKGISPENLSAKHAKGFVDKYVKGSADRFITGFNRAVGRGGRAGVEEFYERTGRRLIQESDEALEFFIESKQGQRLMRESGLDPSDLKRAWDARGQKAVARSADDLAGAAAKQASKLKGASRRAAGKAAQRGGSLADNALTLADDALESKAGRSTVGKVLKVGGKAVQVVGPLLFIGKMVYSMSEGKTGDEAFEETARDELFVDDIESFVKTYGGPLKERVEKGISDFNRRVSDKPYRRAGGDPFDTGM